MMLLSEGRSLPIFSKIRGSSEGILRIATRHISGTIRTYSITTLERTGCHCSQAMLRDLLLSPLPKLIRYILALRILGSGILNAHGCPIVATPDLLPVCGRSPQLRVGTIGHIVPESDGRQC